VLDEVEVDFLPVGGYASATRVKDLAELADRTQPLLVLYLGDHDPSGRGMSDRDLPQRLIRYASGDPSSQYLKALLDRFHGEDLAGYSTLHYGLEVRRIALTLEDTEDLGDDLAFPASDKQDDSRHDWFVDVYGELCWELDAMNPNILRERVRGAVMAELDLVEWEGYIAAEQVERESIAKTLSTWKSISGLSTGIAGLVAPARQARSHDTGRTEPHRRRLRRERKGRRRGARRGVAPARAMAHPPLTEEAETMDDPSVLAPNAPAKSAPGRCRPSPEGRW
jgi:hypothetical protein